MKTSQLIVHIIIKVQCDLYTGLYASLISFRLFIIYHADRYLKIPQRMHYTFFIKQIRLDNNGDKNDLLFRTKKYVRKTQHLLQYIWFLLFF